MWSSIVVGTDGSPTAQEALRQAAALATLCGSTLSVAHAYEPVPASAVLTLGGAGTGLLVDPGELLLQQQADAVALLESAVADLEPGRPAHRVFALPGAPADVLLRLASDVQADLIVVGSRGMQGARRLLLGSVPNRISHHASCSVLVVSTC